MTQRRSNFEFVSFLFHWRAHTEAMVMNALKLVSAAALILITAGAWPSPRYGSMIALGICIMAALALHFAVP
jgi:hypothetical protein